MSAGGEGLVLALPLAVVGISAAALAAVAVGVAGAGVVVVREGGRVVVACGSELRAIAGEQLAMQQALRMAARAYENRLLGERLDEQREAASESAARFARARSLRERLEHERAALQAATAHDESAAAERLRSLREQVLAAAPPLGVRTPDDRGGLLSGWPARLRQARALAEQIGGGLERYRTGARSGLFRVERLFVTLGQAQAQLAALHESAIEVALGAQLPDTAQLDRALDDLHYLDRRLLELATKTPHQLALRRTALDALSRAAAAYERAAAAPEAADHAAPLALATATLDDAAWAFDACAFQRAAQLAAAAEAQLAALATAVGEQRQRNLTLFLDVLEQRVSALSELPQLASEARSWLERCAACKAAAAADPANAWPIAEALADSAEALQRRGLELLVAAAATNMADLTRETLGEMGYPAELDELAEGRKQLIATRDGRKIAVLVGASGETSMRFEGFGDESCQAVQRELIARLRAKGVVGAWKERFTLASAVQQTVSLLNRHGLNVRVEPSEGGVTVVASGKLDASATISYDGAVHADSAWQEAVRSGALDDLEAGLRADAVRQAEEFHERQREHAQWLQAATIRVGEG